MSSRFYLAVFVSALIAFFGGWLIFGVVFSDYYSSNTSADARLLMRDPPVMWAIALANIAWALLITSVIKKTGKNTFSKGFLTGLWISFLIGLIFDLSVFAFWEIYSLGFTAADILISSFFWAIIGGISGAILGYGKKSPPAL